MRGCQRANQQEMNEFMKRRMFGIWRNEFRKKVEGKYNKCRESKIWG